jgi:hypothetical protein
MECAQQKEATAMLIVVSPHFESLLFLLALTKGLSTLSRIIHPFIVRSGNGTSRFRIVILGFWIIRGGPPTNGNTTVSVPSTKYGSDARRQTGNPEII